jgi:hypothetical protein
MPQEDNMPQLQWEGITLTSPSRRDLESLRMVRDQTILDITIDSRQSSCGSGHCLFHELPDANPVQPDFLYVDFCHVELSQAVPIPLAAIQYLRVVSSREMIRMKNLAGG